VSEMGMPADTRAFLDTDGSILSKAEPETKGAVSTILESARKTLGDLESFVERYQVIKKTKTNNGGFVVERSWSEVVLANYRTFKWTTEGGDITELRNMLHMHTNTIHLTMQALQSRSLSRLERTVMPMAERVGEIHDHVHGDLSDKINDLHRIIMAVANSTPSLLARDRALNDANSLRNSSRNSSSTISTIENDGRPTRAIEAPRPRGSLSPNIPNMQLDRRESAAASPGVQVLAAVNARMVRTSSILSGFPLNALHSRFAKLSFDCGDCFNGLYIFRSSSVSVKSCCELHRLPMIQQKDSAYYSMNMSEMEREVRRLDMDFENGFLPDESYSNFIDGAGYSPGKFSDVGPSLPKHRRESKAARRESTTLPNLFSAIDEAETAEQAAAGSPQDDGYCSAGPSTAQTPTYRSKANSIRSASGKEPRLPPPAISPGSPSDRYSEEAATPSSLLRSPKRSRSNSKDCCEVPSVSKSVRRNQGERLDSSQFERSLFRNAAILCDLQGQLVEYAVHVPDEPDPRYNTEMKGACKECRICVIRKRENREHGGTKVVTSIWALSEDGEVRLQQKLSEINETVPYCSYFDSTKVSLPPTEGEISLKFHAEDWAQPLRDEIKTNWVNYVFTCDADATSFQSAVFGRMLIGSFRTMKSIVIHEGIKGAFTFEEQFANIEMLRLWEDDGICMPGAAGGVLAMMHISSNFGEGWARFWINCSKQQVRIKDDGPKHAKIKGIDVLVVKPGTSAAVADRIRSQQVSAGERLQRVDTLQEARPSGGKRTFLKKVNGIRVEFKTEEEKRRFMSLAKRCQERPIPLPDL